MNYRYITISPRTAPLEQVTNANSEYNKGVAREMALAQSAHDVLAALEHLLADAEPLLQDSAQSGVLIEARNAISKARGAK